MTFILHVALAKLVLPVASIATLLDLTDIYVFYTVTHRNASVAAAAGVASA